MRDQVALTVNIDLLDLSGHRIDTIHSCNTEFSPASHNAPVRAFGMKNAFPVREEFYVSTQDQASLKVHLVH